MARIIHINMPVIRRGEAQDLTEIEAIQAASPESAHWDVTGYLQYDLRVEMCGSRVAGFLVARSVADGENELLNLAVGPEFRRQGVARRLVASLIAGMRGEIFLEVRESNKAARNLYKSMDFKEVSRREKYYESPAEAAIVMKFHSC
jgi:ribosomal-protein-alanine N-acetyltransferase